jgi:hypothetical protein
MMRTESDLRELYRARVDNAADPQALLAWLEDRPRSTRRKRVALSLAVAAIVVGLAVAGVGLGGQGNSGQHPVTGQTVAPATHEPAAQGVQGAFIDASHPRVLHLVIMVGTPKAGGGCVDRGAPTITSQTRKDIAISVATPPGAASPRRLRLCGSRLTPLTPVRLKQPLGTRRVIDTLSGRAVPVIDLSSVPSLATVPAGYVAEPVQLFLTSVSDTGVVEPAHVSSVHPGPLDDTLPEAVRAYRKGAAVISISTGTADPQYDPTTLGGRSTGPLTVDGHPAHAVIFGPASVCVTWKPSEKEADLVCSNDDPLSAQPAGRAALTVDQVLTIAQGLH